MKLSLNEISYISSKLEKVSDISLFANVSAVENGTEEISLLEKGVMDEGILMPQSKDMIDLVATAKSCARVILRDPLFVIEKYSYRRGDEYALVENDGGDMVFSAVSGFSGVKDSLRSFIGESEFRTADVDMKLRSSHFITYMALIDHHRFSSMKEYMGDGPLYGATDKSLLDEMNKPRPNSLAHMMVKQYGFKLPTIDEIKASIGVLEEMGCVVTKDGVLLSGDHALMAGGVLIPEWLLMMESVRVDEKDELSAASGLCISAGVRDSILLTFTGEEVEVSTVSTAELLDLVEAYMMCPEA
jgi:hypothetical protein